jgi:hypothetical protein
MEPNMSDPNTYPPVELPSPGGPRDKFEREYRAFLRLLPELLPTLRGKYVAVHEERGVGSGEDKVEVALAAYKQYGYVPLYVGLVDELPVQQVRIPHSRVISWGNAQ